MPRKKYAPCPEMTVCSKCNQPRDAESHKQYYGSWFCANTATESLEEWRARMEAKRKEKTAHQE